MIKKLKQFMITKPVLQKILRAILLTEEQDKCNHENVKKNKSHKITVKVDEEKNQTLQKQKKWQELLHTFTC
jgi:biopolymer transport protein ExbD